MHLLKGYSSNEDLITALKSLEAKRRGEPVVVDAQEFFYSRIALAIGSDVLIQILDGEGNWIYCNETAAEYLGHTRDWFPGHNLFEDRPSLTRDWRGVIADVASTPPDLHRPQPARFARHRLSQRIRRGLERHSLPHDTPRRSQRRRPYRTHPRSNRRLSRLSRLIPCLNVLATKPRCAWTLPGPHSERSQQPPHLVQSVRK